LLLETDFQDLVDRILVVVSDEKIRIKRVKQRDNRSLDEIQAIIACQVNDDKRIKAADDILENNSDFSMLASEVNRLHEKYICLSSAYK
jgi:dephospho-CoA kinase